MHYFFFHHKSLHLQHTSTRRRVSSELIKWNFVCFRGTASSVRPYFYHKHFIHGTCQQYGAYLEIWAICFFFFFFQRPHAFASKVLCLSQATSATLFTAQGVTAPLILSAERAWKQRRHAQVQRWLGQVWAAEATDDRIMRGSYQPPLTPHPTHLAPPTCQTSPRASSHLSISSSQVIRDPQVNERCEGTMWD